MYLYQARATVQDCWTGLEGSADLYERLYNYMVGWSPKMACGLGLWLAGPALGLRVGSRSTGQCDQKVRSGVMYIMLLQSRVEEYWTGVLDRSTGREYWTGVLDGSTGQEYWTGVLDGSIGREYWTGVLDRSTGQEYCTGVLDRQISMKISYMGTSRWPARLQALLSLHHCYGYM